MNTVRPYQNISPIKSFQTNEPVTLLAPRPPSVWGINYDEGFERFSLSVSAQYSIGLWLEGGIHPGGMYTHILTGDLVGLMLMDDRSEQAAVRSIVRFMVKYAPIGSWGTEANVKMWPIMVKQRRASPATPGLPAEQSA